MEDLLKKYHNNQIPVCLHCGNKVEVPNGFSIAGIVNAPAVGNLMLKTNEPHSEPFRNFHFACFEAAIKLGYPRT